LFSCAGPRPRLLDPSFQAMDLLSKLQAGEYEQKIDNFYVISDRSGSKGKTYLFWLRQIRYQTRIFRLFIGRRKELSLLEDAYSINQSAFIPVYGRRRVGKSELILKFIGHKPGIYYLGKMAPAALQIREFLQEAARVLDEPLLSSLSTDNWSDVFTAVTNKCKSKAVGRSRNKSARLSR
jgi:hypothetical protein